MADDDVDDVEEGEEEEGKSVGGKRLILIIVILLLLIGGGITGAYFAGVFGGEDTALDVPSEGEHDDGHAGDKDKENEEAGAMPVYYELPEFLVNLSTTGNKVSFLKMRVTLELTAQEDVIKIDAHKPKIQNAFNTYLRELRASDLSGSAGMYRLREELLTRLNKAVHPVMVKDILFSEIIVQ